MRLSSFGGTHHNISPETPGELGRTRLLWAAEAGDLAVVELLLARGARLAPKSAGRSALSLAKNAATRAALALAAGAEIS